MIAEISFKMQLDVSEPSALSCFIYSPDFLCLVLFGFQCMFWLLRSHLCCLRRQMMIRLWKRTRADGTLDSLIISTLIISHFQHIITVKYYVSSVPRIFIISKFRILMPVSVKTGSVWLYFQGNRGHIGTYIINIHIGRIPRIYQLVYVMFCVFVFHTKRIILSFWCTRHRWAIKSCNLHLMWFRCIFVIC